jgi:cytosine deaminase
MCSAAALLREAMGLGADVVGGIPWIGPGPAAAEHIRACFDLAVEFEKNVSMLLDDTGDAASQTLEAMAREAIARGWQGRALALHCTRDGAVSG